MSVNRNGENKENNDSFHHYQYDDDYTSVISIQVVSHNRHYQCVRQSHTWFQGNNWDWKSIGQIKTSERQNYTTTLRPFLFLYDTAVLFIMMNERNAAKKFVFTCIIDQTVDLSKSIFTSWLSVTRTNTELLFSNVPGQNQSQTYRNWMDTTR